MAQVFIIPSSEWSVQFSACHSSPERAVAVFAKYCQSRGRVWPVSAASASPGLPGSGGCLRPRPLPPPASQKLPRMAITEGRAGWGGGRENLKIIQLIHSDTHPWSQTFNLHFLPRIKFNGKYIFFYKFCGNIKFCDKPPSPVIFLIPLSRETLNVAKLTDSVGACKTVKYFS